jgi:hypothetical protein
MALPTPSKTWQYSRNNTNAAQGSALANGKRLIRTIKDALSGVASSPWVVRYSSNGVNTGSVGDGVDRWVTDADIVGGAPGVAHSWIVLRQTGIANNYEICFDILNSGTPNWSIICSPSASFSGGNLTNRPYAGDEIALISSTSFGTNSGDVQHRYSVAVSTDGQCTRVITCAAGGVTGLWILDKPTNSTSGWVSGSFSLIYASSTGLTMSPSNLSTLGRAKIAGTTATLQVLSEGTTTAMAVNDVTFGNIANEVDGTWPMFPIAFASTTTGVRGRHGTLQDIWFGSASVVSGEGYPGDGTNSFMSIGQVVIPWGGDSTGLNLT